MLTKTYLHSDWEFIRTDHQGQKVGFSQAEWLPAAVPGHIHLDLVANGIIADPFERMNELGCQWVDQCDWSYRTKFQWAPTDELANRVLRFEGLDTVCTVTLNGETIAQSDNMFIPLEIDVTHRLVEGENELQIDFRSAVKVGEERRAEYFAKEGLPPEKPYLQDRAFVRKAQYMYGWDWGPRLVSCGVWRPVTLIEFASRILDVHVSVRHKDPDLYIVDLVTEYQGEGTVVHCLEGVGCRVGDGQFVLQNPELWDPRDAQLLTLTTGIYPADADLDTFEIDPDSLDDEAQPLVETIARTLLHNEGHDAISREVGICEVKLLREPDEFGESFEFEVNGQKIWARGANWIPDHSFPAIVSRERYREQIERCVDMGFNMLRVWGGGLYETDEFYELCDEYGILVWQDFPFACSFYPDDEDAQRVIAEEALVNIKRIRNHPCLALWCGNNENHEMYYNMWGGQDNQPPRYFGEPIYEKVLPEVLAKSDPRRSYVASSPIGSPPAEKVADEKRRGPNADGYGDQHNWDVWHGRGDWRFYTDSKGRFSSEFGFASSPTMECWAEAKIGPDEEFDSPTARWHDKTGKGYNTFVGYVKLHYPDPVTLEDWSYYSQLNQRDALRYGIEHYRRSSFCRGSLVWQVNDCWPTQSWAMLDSLGNYKALAYEIRRLYGDRLLSIDRKNEHLHLIAANDGQDVWADSFLLQAFDTETGELVKEWELDTEVDTDARETVISVDLSGLNVNQTLIMGQAVDADAPVWRLLGEPKSTRFPAPAPLTVSVHEDGLLRVETSVPLVDLMLIADGSVRSLIDNFITVPSPSVFDVRISSTPTKLEARSLAGVHRVKIVRGPI